MGIVQCFYNRHTLKKMCMSARVCILCDASKVHSKGIARFLRCSIDGNPITDASCVLRFFVNTTILPWKVIGIWSSFIYKKITVNSTSILI